MRRRALLTSLSGHLNGHVGGRVPTSPVARRSPRAVVEARTAREVIEVAVRSGEAMLSLGAAAADVDGAIRRTCGAYGVQCQVDVTFTSILVAADAGPDGPGTSVLRVVETRVVDYDRLARLEQLMDRVLDRPHPAGPLDAGSAAAEALGGREQLLDELEAVQVQLDGVLGAPHRYRPSVVTSALAVMAAAVVVLLGGGPAVVVLAALTTAVIDLSLRWLGRWGLPLFFLQVAGAAVSTTVAVLLLAVVPGLPPGLTALPPSLVVGSGIVVLLAGMSMVGAADDAINGYPVTASGRLLEVMLLTLGLVVGIGGVLDLARRLGVDLVLADTSGASWPLPVQVLGAAVASGAWAVASFAGPRSAVLAGAAGGVAWLVQALLVQVGLPPAAGAALAALLVGAFAQRSHRRTRVPVTVVTSCGIVPLLPGLSIYQGMLDLVSGSEDGGRLMEAALVGVALAAGATLGRSLAARR